MSVVGSQRCAEVEICSQEHQEVSSASRPGCNPRLISVVQQQPSTFPPTSLLLTCRLLEVDSTSEKQEAKSRKVESEVALAGGTAAGELALGRPAARGVLQGSPRASREIQRKYDSSKRSRDPKASAEVS